MQPSKLAIRGMVCVLTLSLGPEVLAQSRAGRQGGYTRGGDATRVAVPRTQVVPPVGVRGGPVVRASSQRGARYAPGRPGGYYRGPVYRSYGSGYRGYPGYRGYRAYGHAYGYPYGHRHGYGYPGFGVGVYFGGAYGFYGAVGYPYVRPYPYPYPYAYPYPYPYPAPAYGYPAGSPYGGVRLEVLPRHAEVIVDGYYAGTVDDFDGSFQRLELEDGAHKIEIRAPGFQPAAFDVNVLAGQTVKYRGDLIPAP